MEFTAEDLTQNRRGQLSPMQMQKLDVLRDMFVSDLHDTPPLHIPSVIRLMIMAVLAGILHLLGVLDRLQDWLGAGYRPLLFGGGLLLLGWLVWDQFRYAAMAYRKLRREGGGSAPAGRGGWLWRELHQAGQPAHPGLYADRRGHRGGQRRR